MWNVARTGEEFDKFAKRTGLDITKIDALGKATELAGGNASSMREAIKRWMMSGRSYDDFLYTAKRVSGLDELQRARYLEQMQLPPDAVAAFQEFGDNALKIAEALEKISITPHQAKVAREFTQTFDLLREYVGDIGRQFGEIVLPVVTNVMRRCIAFFNELKKHPKETKQILTVIAALLGMKFLKYLGSAIGLLGRILGLTRSIQTVGKVGVFGKGLGVLGAILTRLKLVGGLILGITLSAMLLHSYFKKYPDEWDRLCKKVEEFRKKLASLPIIGDFFKTDEEKRKAGLADTPDKRRAQFAKEHPYLNKFREWQSYRYQGKAYERSDEEKQAIKELNQETRDRLVKGEGQGYVTPKENPQVANKAIETSKPVFKDIGDALNSAFDSISQPPRAPNEQFPIYELPMEGIRWVVEGLRRMVMTVPPSGIKDYSETTNNDNRKTENTTSVTNNQSTENKNVTNNNAVSNTTTNNVQNEKTNISNSVINNKYETKNDTNNSSVSNTTTNNVYKEQSQVQGFKPIDWSPMSRFASSFDRATNALDESMASFVLAVSPYILGSEERQAPRLSPNAPSVMAQTISHNTTNTTNAPVQNVNITNELNYAGNSSPSDVMRGVSRVMTRNTLGIQRMLGVANTGTCVKA